MGHAVEFTPQDTPLTPAERTWPKPAHWWPDEKEQKLRTMLDQGYGTTEIAKELGVTRNSIIGKTGRLKLQLNGHKPTGRPQKPFRFGQTKAKLHDHNLQTRIKTFSTPQHRERVVLLEESLTLTTDFDDNIPQSQRKSLLELSNYTCKW